MHFTIRRRRKAGEALHHKQAQTFRGRRYCVTNVKSPAAVKCASSNGFTHVLVGHKWKTIKSFRAASHGGHNAGVSKRTRPRSRIIPAKKNMRDAERHVAETCWCWFGHFLYREYTRGWHGANCCKGGVNPSILECLCPSGHRWDWFGAACFFCTS